MSHVPDQPFDAGLQAERTVLAWRRTALAFGLASAAATRVLATSEGRAVLGLGALGFALAVTTYLVADRRYRRVHESLHAGRPLPAAGLSAATMTLAVAVLGCACAAYLAARGLTA